MNRKFISKYTILKICRLYYRNTISMNKYIIIKHLSVISNASQKLFICCHTLQTGDFEAHTGHLSNILN